MQQELKNIFVTKEVAKLAKEKGFDEICAGYYRINEENVFPNSNFDCEFFLGICANSEKFIEAPTHFQLIQWLEGKGFRICKPYTKWLLYDSKFSKLIATFDNIDQALIFALNLINQQENGK